MLRRRMPDGDAGLAYCWYHAPSRFLRARELQPLAQHIQERFARIYLERARPAVDRQLDAGHRNLLVHAGAHERWDFSITDAYTADFAVATATRPR